jgi:hypothetical protein
MPISESDASRHLNLRFPSAEVVVVQDLAARVAVGRITLDSAAGTLRDMGYEETLSLATSQTPVERGGQGRSSGAAPDGGDVRAPSSRSGAPPAEVANWVRQQDRYVPPVAPDVNQWRSGVALPSPPRPATSSSSSATNPAHIRTSLGFVPIDIPPDVSPVRDDASPAPLADRKPVSSPLRPAVVPLHVPGGPTLQQPARARSVTVGQRTAPIAAVPSGQEDHHTSLHLYMTSITSEQMVRDRVRSFERLFFLMSIPFHSYDVAENKFLRKQLVQLCGGVDKGLPLLFVGDRFVGTFDEVQEMVDHFLFIPRLLDLGAVLPPQVVREHREKRAAVERDAAQMKATEAATATPASRQASVASPDQREAPPVQSTTRPVLGPPSRAVGLRTPNVTPAMASPTPTTREVPVQQKMDRTEYDQRLARWLQMI